MGEWHGKLKDSGAGLGDTILAAYDRTRVRVEAFKAGLAKLDPNAAAIEGNRALRQSAGYPLIGGRI